ncbi:MAG TPA: acyl dehydratase, partial [Leptospiraceae bacterium]|nr:acyl dehydratase [Leptospiraceae bacterium]
YGIPAGEVHLQLIGVKNIKAAEAYEKFGDDLFIKENDKKKLGKEKIPEKIFEIERKLVIKKKPL